MYIIKSSLFYVWNKNYKNGKVISSLIIQRQILHTGSVKTAQQRNACYFFQMKKLSYFHIDDW